MNDIIVVHNRYNNEPIVIRISAINVVQKCIDKLDENNREEYTEILVGNMNYDVKEDIGAVMRKIKAVENKYISGKEKNDEKLCWKIERI